MSGWQCDQIWRNFATLAKIKKSWSLFGIWENFELALTVVVNKTHGPSPQTTAVWQLEVTRPKARFKPTSTKKSRVDGGVISCQHILVSCLNCTPMVMSTSYYHLPIPLFISPFKDESAKTYQEVGNEANKFNISSMTDEEVKSELEGLQKMNRSETESRKRSRKLITRSIQTRSRSFKYFTA